MWVLLYLTHRPWIFIFIGFYTIIHSCSFFPPRIAIWSSRPFYITSSTCTCRSKSIYNSPWAERARLSSTYTLNLFEIFINTLFSKKLSYTFELLLHPSLYSAIFPRPINFFNAHKFFIFYPIFNFEMFLYLKTY